MPAKHVTDIDYANGLAFTTDTIAKATTPYIIWKMQLMALDSKTEFIPTLLDEIITPPHSYLLSLLR